MIEPRVNPRFLFPAPGWKCVQCYLDEESDTIEFTYAPIVGWGVTEGYDEGAEMELLVAITDGVDGPFVWPASQVNKYGLYNCVYGFTPYAEGLDVEELSPDFKKRLEEKARATFKKEAA